MNYFLVVLLVIVTLCSAPSSLTAGGRVSVYINPVKPFMGLLNLGVEYQFDPLHSIHISCEYALFRCGWLDRIDHPDFVGGLGLRRYFSREELDTEGWYSGALLGYIWRRGKEGEDAGTGDFFTGAELGYMLPLDSSGYISGRGLVSFPLKSKKILPGAEAVFGKVL